MHGIDIEKISLPKIQISGLYIKLNKKLIVKAKKVDIRTKSSKEESSTTQIQDILMRFPWLNRLFSAIELDDVNINDNIIKIHYKNNSFYIDTDYLTIDTKLQATKNSLDANISSLLLKDFNLSIAGMARGNIKTKELNFQGRFNSFNIKGNLLLHVKNSLLTYYIDSDNFTSLEPFMESLGKKVEIDPEAKAWIYKKITAKNYKLNSLEGKINLKNGNFYPHKMKGVAKVTNATIRFHDDIPPVFAKFINIKLENNTLFFHIPKATYQNIELENQKAHIYNLLTKGNGIILNIHATAKLDEDIQQILKTYKLNIPLIQKSGSTKANLMMDIRFVPYDLDINGTFDVNSSEILLSNTPFYSQNATIKLNNRLLYLYDTNLQYKNIFDINTTGLLDLYKDRYDGNISIKNLHVKSGETDFLHVKETTMPLLIEIKKDDLALFLPKLQTRLNFKNSTNSIIQDNLSILYENSPFMKNLGIYDGNFSLQTEDFNSFNIQTAIHSMKPLLTKDDKPVTNLDLNISISPKFTKINSKNGLIKAKNDNNITTLQIQNADLLLELKSPQTSSTSKDTLIIQGKNSNIKITDFNKTLLLDGYTFTKSNQNIQGKAHYKNGNIALHYAPNSLHVKLLNFDDTFVNTLIQKDIFEDGNFSLTLEGLNAQNLSGHINFKNTHLQTFASYNNILALINSIPALLTFKKPGFNEKGYQVKNSDILFSKKGSIITLHTIDVTGVDADIGGSGVIDLKNETLDLKLKLKTFKDVSKLVEKIPLVNYIFLGDDKSIQTAIQVSGDLNNPTVKTQTVQDVVFSPFNILRRTIQLPFKLLEQEKPQK